MSTTTLTSYDLIPYTNSSFPQTHPDRLAVLAALFFATSLLMSILAGWSRAPRSILLNKPSAPASPTAPAQPIGQGNILDQLKQLQDQSAPSNAPSAPAPAPAAPEQKP